MPDIRIGIAGWVYTPWRGVFYPPTVTQKRELAFAASTFNSIEINATFRGPQRSTTWVKWAAEVPDDFVFSVKGSQVVTHIKRLRDCREPLATFFAQGLLTLGPKLGPILWQLPPTLKFDAAVIEAFLEFLPKDTTAAAKLASVDKPDRKRPIRHAIEVRHESFRDPAFVKLLSDHGVAVVFTDAGGRLPAMDDLTADFTYCRLHGDETLFPNGYDDAALNAWATKIRKWSAGRDVYAYLVADMKLRSPFEASRLSSRLGLRDKPLAPLGDLAARVDELTKLGGSAKANSMNAGKRKKR